LPKGARTKDLIFYAHIGGVPHELLHFDPNSSKNSTLSDADWVKILGTGMASMQPSDPVKHDYSGIDPHMIESYQPRSGLPGASSANNADPINGREWVTNSAMNFVDREYACIFPLPATAVKDCSLATNADICDCPSTAVPNGPNVPPVCDPTTTTKQIAAKAYPTIRETLLAHLMGTQGILSSICPIHTTDTGNDPLYGYRPAVAVIVDRLKNALANQCLPQPLQPDSAGNVPCLILEVLPDNSPCSASAGLSAPDATIAAKYAKDNNIDTTKQRICQVNQLKPTDLVNGSCATSGAAGWCYVTGAAAGTCPQAILFSPTGNPVNGATISLQCIEANTVGDAGSGGAATD
jgi:hypothetical protein